MASPYPGAQVEVTVRCQPDCFTSVVQRVAAGDSGHHSTGECAEVLHTRFLGPQERMNSAICRQRRSGYFPPVVDTGGNVKSASQRAEVDRRSVLVPEHCVRSVITGDYRRHMGVLAQTRYTDGLAEVVDDKSVPDRVPIEWTKFPSFAVSFPYHGLETEHLRRSCSRTSRICGPILRYSNYLSLIVHPPSLPVVATLQRRKGCHFTVFPNGCEALAVRTETAEVLAHIGRTGGFGDDRGFAPRIRTARFAAAVGARISSQSADVDHVEVLVPEEGGLGHEVSLGPGRGSSRHYACVVNAISKAIRPAERAEIFHRVMHFVWG